MSVREAKGRLLSREYMADRPFMTEYTPAEREWYLLTALFADDAGYLPWDPVDNAANLYRYDMPAERDARVAEYVEHFTSTGKFIDLGCGHAQMPSVAKRPRGRAREYSVRAEHGECTTSALPSSPIQSSPIQSSPVEHSASNDAERPLPGESPSAFHARMAREATP